MDRSALEKPIRSHRSIGFLRVLSPSKERIKQESEWKRSRLEAKTGYLPTTEAILGHHDPVKHYHYTNEADLINRIVLGMSAKKFKEIHGVDNVREAVTAAELSELNRLQRINDSLIEKFWLCS